MNFNNERNIKRRIGILTILILLICGAMVWGGIQLKELNGTGSLLFRKTDKIEQLIDKKFKEVIDRIDFNEKPELIDSPIEPLPADTEKNTRDSIQLILKNILKYYEQSATGQQAKA